MSITRRNLLSGAAATLFMPASPLGANPADEEKHVSFLNNFQLEVIHQPENFYGQVDQEVVFLIDVSSSMAADEVQTAITGALSAIREHNYLTNREDERCPGTMGLGFIKFQSSPTSLGYAVLAGNHDVQELETKAASFNLAVGGSTGVGRGLMMAKEMQTQANQLLNAPPNQRTVILIGDEPNNHGVDPVPVSEDIATEHGATVHCIALNQASDYEGVATQYKPSHERNGRWVDEGQVIEANTAQDIQIAILNIINPHCFMSHNLEADQVTTIDHA